MLGVWSFDRSAARVVLLSSVSAVRLFRHDRNLYVAFHGSTATRFTAWTEGADIFVQILIAIGEDYNIYLVTRVFEEQERA